MLWTLPKSNSCERLKRWKWFSWFQGKSIVKKKSVGLASICLKHNNANEICGLDQEEGEQRPRCLQGYQGVDAGNDIIHHDTNTAMDPLIKPGDREGLEDIE